MDRMKCKEVKWENRRERGKDDEKGGRKEYLR
jgi:hypothetical protein